MAKICKRSEDYSKWYTDLIQFAELADYSPVRGCMVVRPNGYEIWENIRDFLDRRIKETGHRNAYFPLLIPESFMRKEAEHVEGFAPECATVTHGGGAELDEPLVIRPTSETIIWHMYGNWIKSHRDLPLKLNQWANVVRWEMRTRPFIRTMEILWQEGHTAHATEAEARVETLQMLEVYRECVEDLLAMPVILGRKTEHERFAGAVDTYTLEGLMQDGKALQMGTSHYLGDKFAVAFDVKYQDQEGNLKFVHATSWGITTRLIGALIMIHGDDQGLIVPPKVAARPIVIVPIYNNDADKAKVLAEANKLKAALKEYGNITIDDRDDVRPGFKFNEWELLGIPLRIELGPKDVDAGQAVCVRRDTREKAFVKLGDVPAEVKRLLAQIQHDLFAKAKERRDGSMHKVDTKKEFAERCETGGFLLAHWCGSRACEKAVTEETKATIRCIPLNNPQEAGHCIHCNGASKERVLFARAY